MATRFLSRNGRKLALCVLELDSELYRIVSTVSESAIAQIRLQWWRDEAEKIIRGHDSQKTLAAQALTVILSRPESAEKRILALIDAYDDQISGLPGDHATRLFAALFEIHGEDENLMDRYAALAGRVFTSANTGALDRASATEFAKALCEAPEVFWPWLCLFEFTSDWQEKRQPAPVERRWRYLMAFLRGERALAKKLERIAETLKL